MKIFILLFSILLLAASAYAETGFVNVQQLFLESKDGKKATQKLQETRQKKEKELQAKKDELDKLKDKIAKASNDKKDVSELLKLYGEQEKEFKRQAEDTEIEYKSQDKELSEEFLKKATPLLHKIAKEKNFSMVITNPSVLGYIDPAVDITAELIKALDK